MRRNVYTYNPSCNSSDSYPTNAGVLKVELLWTKEADSTNKRVTTAATFHSHLW